MADNPSFDVFFRLGKNSTSTSRTGTASSFLYIPVDVDGGNMTGSNNVVAVPTQHQTSGVKYHVLGKKNGEEQTLAAPFYPENAGTLLNAATTFESDSLPSYHHGEVYWGTGISGTTPIATGAKLLGMLFTGVNFSIDRDGEGQIGLSMPCMVNQDVQLTSAAPSPTWPTQDPYTQGLTYIDVEFANSSGTFTAFTDNNADLKSMGFNFSNATEIYAHDPSSTASLDRTWTRASPGTHTLTGDLVFYFGDEKYENYGRDNFIQKMRARIMGIGSAPNASTTTTGSNAAGSSIVVTVASTSGFAVNDYCMLADIDNSKRCVAKVTALSTTANTLTFDTLDVAIDGSGANAATVKNTAWEHKIHTANIQGKGKRSTDGSKEIVTLSYEATILTGQTNLLTTKAYDDDGA